MGTWAVSKSDLKRYPHFDAPISAESATAYATDPGAVAKHAFFPFIRYAQRWTRFADTGEHGSVKERLIRYAARRDAYIFAYYRYLLAEQYENELTKRNLEKCVLAYRRVSSESGKGGKCNIHFASDAFKKVEELGSCCVVALDISSFFESLDHDRLKAEWAKLLCVDRLPPDHFNVFRALTRYAFVDKVDLYTRLGHFGPKRTSKTGNSISGYLTQFKAIPQQLCTGKEFREKIAGKGLEPSIIKTNDCDFGIPQGAALSDLLANLYLLDFDAAMAERASSLGGAYFRYSDDILIITPGDKSVGVAVMQFARELIGKYGKKLEIKEAKSSIHLFTQLHGKRTCAIIHGVKGRNGLEYLGFRYDGTHVYIRDSTLAGLYRKVTISARREARACAKRYPDKSGQELAALIQLEPILRRFGRVEHFGEKHSDYRKWTFWSYAQKATRVFGPLGTPIRRQLRSLARTIEERALAELEKVGAARSRT